MKDFLAFRRMITPIFIQVLFWIGVALCVLGGLIFIVQGATARYGGGQMVLVGLLSLILGPFFWRIYCEIVILFFRINETLTDIKNNTEK